VDVLSFEFSGEISVEIRRRRRFRDVQESSSGDAGGATCSCCCCFEQQQQQQHLPRLDVEKGIILIERERERERERESDPSVALDNTQLGFYLGEQWVDLFLACGIHSIPEAAVMKRNREYGFMRDFMGVLGRSSGETEGISAAAAPAAFLSSSETTPPLPPALRVRQIGDQASSKTFSSFPIPSIFPHGQAAAAAAGFAIGQAAGAGAGLGVNSRPNFAISGTTAALGALGNSLSEKPGSRGGAAAGGGGGGGGFTGFSGGSLHQKTRPQFTTSAMLAGGGGSGKKDHQVKVVVADDSRIMMGGAALQSSSSAAAVGAGAAVSEGGRERAAAHANGKPLEELAASYIQQLSREDCWRLILEVGMYHQVSDLLCFV
jgi:hypothetical protein